MKKKQLNLDRKLVLQKNWVGALMKTDKEVILGGATLMGDTTPCHACPGPTYTCPTAVNCAPNTNLTVGNPCCGISK